MNIVFYVCLYYISFMSLNPPQWTFKSLFVTFVKGLEYTLFCPKMFLFLRRLPKGVL